MYMYMYMYTHTTHIYMYIFIYLYIDIRLWGVRDGQMGCNRVAGVGMMKGRGPTPQTQASPPHPRPPFPALNPKRGHGAGGPATRPRHVLGFFLIFSLFCICFIFYFYCFVDL